MNLFQRYYIDNKGAGLIKIDSILKLLQLSKRVSGLQYICTNVYFPQGRIMTVGNVGYNKNIVYVIPYHPCNYQPCKS